MQALRFRQAPKSRESLPIRIPELNVEDSVFDVKADFDSYSDGNDVVGILLWGQNGKQENISVNVKGNSVIKVGGKNAFAQGIQLGMKTVIPKTFSSRWTAANSFSTPPKTERAMPLPPIRTFTEKFVMNGGEVSGNVTELALAYIGNVDLTVNGGNFAVDPSAYLAEGHTATKKRQPLDGKVNLSFENCFLKQSL